MAFEVLVGIKNIGLKMNKRNIFYTHLFIVLNNNSTNGYLSKAIQGLDSGERKTILFNLVKYSDYGSVKLKVKVDSSGFISELIENNNTMEKKFDLR